MKRTLLTLALISTCLLTSCESNNYQGPGVRFSLGWKGVDFGLDLLPRREPAPAPIVKVEPIFPTSGK